ncbi:MAG: acyl-CoA dehydrogenase family protein [Nitrospinae bacterium]|nr:acyl-CoA dehydrogenase family protein [Nitrospinota bacterium]
MLSVDFYGIEDQLTDEEKMVQESAAKFVDREVLPIIADCFERGEFPMALVKKMGGEGFLGAALKTHGGAGIGPIAYGLMMQELERGDSGIRSFVSVQNSLVIYPIDRFGSQEQKDKWLPPLVSGDKIGCFGLTEADYGSDPGGMKTHARADGDSYVLNGSKMWITNAGIADLAVVWAYLDGVARGFLVEADRPGITMSPIRHKFSMRASVTGDIVLNDCRVPRENLLPGTAAGLVSALQCLNQARNGIAWGVLGAAMACYREAVEHAKMRIMFGKPIGSYQLVQEKLADMLTGITAGQTLCMQLGRLMRNGGADHAQISMAKRNNARVALDTARKARDVLGASGISVEYSTIRHMLNLESVFTYEGTDSIHTLILGKKITGIDAVKR